MDFRIEKDKVIMTGLLPLLINEDESLADKIIQDYEPKYKNINHYILDFNCKTAEELKTKIEKVKDSNSNSVDDVVLYPTNDLEELDSVYFRYMALPDDERLKCDHNAEEIFGMTNRELYEFVKSNMIKDKSTKDEVETYTPTEESSIFTNDLPLFTPKELLEKIDEDYSCLNESEAESVKRWREEYALMGIGIKTENYNKYNLERINILRKAIYENNNEAIMQCGWIPGIEFNSENRVKASEIVREKMEASVKDIIDGGSKFAEWIYNSDETIEDVFNRESYIYESSSVKEKKAVSLVFVAGTSIVAKTIRKVQGTQFSHASISLDDDLDRIYSYNMRDGFNGLTYESVKGYIEDGVQRMGVYTFLVSDKIYKNLEKSLDKFNLYIDKTKYSILNLLTIPINIPLDMDMKMVCSEFVDKLLKTAELDLTNKKSSLVGPKDLIIASNTKTNIVEVFNGNPKDLKPLEIKKKIRKIKKSNLPIFEFVEYNDQVITEAKSFPVQFDKDGNLILKNIRKINFEQEYADSHRLLKSYEKDEAYELMKFELAKMHFFITLLEKKIYKQGKDKSVNELKVRARFLNDFKKYLSLVIQNDPDFNFSEYYEHSPFNDAMIKIDKSTLEYGYRALKYLLK